VRDPFWGYQDLAVLIGLALPVLLVSALTVQLAVFLVPMLFASRVAGVLFAQFLAYGLWFFCLWSLFRLRYGKPFWTSLGWVSPPRGLALYIILGAGLAIGVALLGAALRTPDVAMPMKELLQDSASLVLVGAFAVSLGPLCEELAFRGFILPLVARSLGAVAGILLTAAGFALLHGPQYAWSWQHISLITLAGAVFGMVRLRSGSTAAATVMHAAYNFTFFVAYAAQPESPALLLGERGSGFWNVPTHLAATIPYLKEFVFFPW
jgi:membrane protease YdiL (CAAX protease family)